MPSRPLAAFVIGLVAFAFVPAAAAQVLSLAQAKEKFSAAIKKPDRDARQAGVDILVASRDPGALDDFVAVARAQEKRALALREEIATTGKELQKIWKAIDGQGGKGRAVYKNEADLAEKKAEVVKKRLTDLDGDLRDAELLVEMTRDGAGRLLASLDGTVRAAQILTISKAVQNMANADDRVLFISILGRTPAPEARDALTELALRSNDGQVRTAAVDSLSALEDPTAAGVLSAALKDEQWTVRVAAARGLTSLGALDAVPALADALAGTDGRVLDDLMEALEDLTGVTYFDNGQLWADWYKKQATEMKSLTEHLRDGGPVALAAAAPIVGEKGLLGGVRVLMRAAGMHPDIDAKSHVKRAPATRPSLTGPEVAAANALADARCIAIGKAINTRKKNINERAINRLLRQPFAAAVHAENGWLGAAYLRAMGSVHNANVRETIEKYASAIPAAPGAEMEEELRIGAVEALGYQDPDAVALLVRIMTENAMKPSKAVRTAAVAALVRQNHMAGVPGLAAALADGGEIAAAALAGLKAITSQNLGNAGGPWHEWWLANGQTAKLPPRRTADQDGGADTGNKGGTNFYGINTRSKHLMYVLDISGSMNTKDAGEYASQMTRIEAARKELIGSIRSLTEDSTFNIIFFNHEVTIWKPKVVTATKDIKAEAVKYVEAIQAVGATNAFDALEKAFELAGRGTFDKHYGIAVDTIFFMSDGEPNRGRLVETKAILRELTRLNELRKVRIHTVGVGKDQDKKFMQAIAQLTGGTYVAK